MGGRAGLSAALSRLGLAEPELNETRVNTPISVGRTVWQRELMGDDTLFTPLCDKLPKEFNFIRELTLSGLWRAPERWEL